MASVAKGKMRFYRLLDEKPVVRTYKKALTLLSLEPMVMELRELTSRIVLFGSAAEGADTSESDSDLLMVTNQKSRVREILREHKRINDRKLSPVILTPSEF